MGSRDGVAAACGRTFLWCATHNLCFGIQPRRYCELSHSRCSSPFPRLPITVLPLPQPSTFQLFVGTKGGGISCSSQGSLTPKPLVVEGFPRDLQCLASYSGTKRVVAGGNRGMVWDLDVTKHRVIRSCALEHCKRITAVACTSDGTLCAVGIIVATPGKAASPQRTAVSVLEGATLQQLQRLPLTSGHATALAWNSDGSSLAVGSNDGGITIWRRSDSGGNGTGNGGSAAFVPVLESVKGEGKGVAHLAWSVDGKLLCSGDAHGEVRYWRVAAGISAAAAEASEGKRHPGVPVASGESLSLLYREEYATEDNGAPSSQLEEVDAGGAGSGGEGREDSSEVWEAHWLDGTGGLGRVARDALLRLWYGEDQDSDISPQHLFLRDHGSRLTFTKSNNSLQQWQGGSSVSRCRILSRALHPILVNEATLSLIGVENREGKTRLTLLNATIFTPSFLSRWIFSTEYISPIGPPVP